MLRLLWAVAFLFLVTLRSCSSQNETSMNICSTCGCWNETIVDCSSQEFHSLSEDFWNGIQELCTTEEINLSNNPLKKLSAFPELEVLKLNLSGCHIETIERGGFSNLLKLQSLDLSRNTLDSTDLNRRAFMGRIQPAIRIFNDMSTLDLSYNFIDSFHQDMFSFMPYLKVLVLTGNPLVSIDPVTMAAITSLTKLTVLKLNACKVESLPEGFFRRSSQLTTLDISDNRLTTIPSALADASNLKTLNLSRNPIPDIAEGNSLAKLNKLEKLYLSNMKKLQNISASGLAHLESLEVLNVDWNPRLNDLDPLTLSWTDEHDHQRWPPIKELYLNNNNLSEISSHLLNRWDLLTALDVGYNPYICDCRNTWMVNVLIPLMLNLNANGSDHVVCSKPSEMRGVTFKNLNGDQKVLECEEKDRLEGIPEMETVVLLGVMIGVFITFPVILVIVVMWKRGVFEKFRSQFQEDCEEEKPDDFQEMPLK